MELKKRWTLVVTTDNISGGRTQYRDLFICSSNVTSREVTMIRSRYYVFVMAITLALLLLCFTAETSGPG